MLGDGDWLVELDHDDVLISNCLEICNDAIRCVDCYRINSRKVQRPSYEELITDKQSMSMVEIGKKYGVSDNAIRKWIKSYEKLMPT
jgi:hypothetical protein